VANRWLCSAVGTFNSGAWNGEIATMSFSGAARDTGFFGIDVINEMLPEFGAGASGASSSTTHMTLSMGSSGIGAWTDANQGAICEAMWAFVNALKAYQATTFSWNEIRLSAIESTGQVVNGATVGTITSPLVGTATMNAPPQLAVVNSHRTGGRGPRNRGRNYMPVHSYTSNTTADGLIATAVKTALNTASKTFVDTCNALTGIRSGVVSPLHQTYSDITSVAVGDEFDTQRRRKNARRELYTVLSL